MARKSNFQYNEHVYIPSSLNDSEWIQFETLVKEKYSRSYAPTILTYSRRFHNLLSEVGGIERIPSTIRNNAIKSLIILAKFLGVHEEFKSALKSYGIKLSRPDALAAFTRIYTNRNSDLGEWLEKVKSILKLEERLLLRFLGESGLRMNEGVTAFNLVISLSKEGKLGEYLNSELGILEHFRFKKQFIRGTKNAYITIVPEALIKEISESKPVTYNAILKRLQRRGLKCRINELRDFYGTFMVKHNLVREEADLLCGRIPPSIFVRHYFSPAIKELRVRVLKALSEMAQAS